MTAPRDKSDPPMGEPGKRPSGGDVGGMRSTTDSGVADWTQRSTERSEEPAIGRATTGEGAGGGADPRLDLGGKAAPGSAPGASPRSERPASDDRAAPKPAAKRSTGKADAGVARNNAADDDEDEWRHEPIAPVDETNPLRSLGKAVGDTVTGSDPDTPAPRKR